MQDTEARGVAVRGGAPGLAALVIAVLSLLPGAAAARASDSSAATTDPVQDLPLFMQVREFRKAGEYDRALVAARRMLLELQADPGAKDYELLNRGRLVRDLEQIAALPPEVRREIAESERQIDAYGPAMTEARWADAVDAATRMRDGIERHLGARHHDVATSLHLLAMARQQQGRYAEADTLFARSREIYGEILGPKAVSVAMSLTAHADLAFAAGDYAAATDRYREGIRLYRTYHPENVGIIAREMRAMARVLLRRGMLRDADVVLTEAMALSRHSAEEGSVASIAGELANVLRARGEPRRAEPLLRESLALRRKTRGEHPRVAQALMDLADLLEGDGRDTEALEHRREALAIRIATLGADHPEVARSRKDVASSRLRTGHPDAAEALYREALAGLEASVGPDHAEAAAAHAGLGDVACARGRWAAGETHYREALRILRGALGPHHREVTEILKRLAGTAWQRHDPATAVHWLEQASRSFEESRRRVGSAVERATFQESPDPLLAAALLECGRAEEAWIPAERSRGRILDDLIAAGGETPAGSSVVPASRVAEALRPGEAIVGWLETEPAPGVRVAWGWTLRRDGPVQWTRLPAEAGDVGRRLRGALELAGSWPFRIPRDPKVENAARDVAAARIHPLLGGLAGVERLIVVPSGGLTGIPVEMLPLGVPQADAPTVGDRLLVSYVPSATIHTRLRARPTRLSPGEALVVEGSAGDGSGGAVSALSGAAREVEAVARRLPGARVLAGNGRAESELRRLAARDELRRFRTVHFAGHALVDGLRPERSALVLSVPNEGDMLQAALAGRPIPDGRLTAWEILRDWRLDADLVTLSACATALGKRVAGEGYLGFAHSFLHTGARSLVLSLWKVDDEASALLMDRFYDNLAAGAGRTAALRDARHWLRDLPDDSGERVYRHPAYWAAFVLVGDPGE